MGAKPMWDAATTNRVVARAAKLVNMAGMKLHEALSLAQSEQLPEDFNYSEQYLRNPYQWNRELRRQLQVRDMLPDADVLPLRVVLAPGQSVDVEFQDSDGVINVAFSTDALRVTADLPDTTGRGGESDPVIYEERFGELESKDAGTPGMPKPDAEGYI